MMSDTSGAESSDLISRAREWPGHPDCPACVYPQVTNGHVKFCAGQLMRDLADRLERAEKALGKIEARGRELIAELRVQECGYSEIIELEAALDAYRAIRAEGG